VIANRSAARGYLTRSGHVAVMGNAEVEDQAPAPGLILKVVENGAACLPSLRAGCALYGQQCGRAQPDTIQSCALVAPE
jgi:hypothetical protein